MPNGKKRKISRAIIDRRAPQDRRVLDLGPRYPLSERRESRGDRRKGWEDRYGWERTSRWSSIPIYSEIP